MINHTQHTQALTLEQQAAELIISFADLERRGKAFSSEVRRLFVAFSAERGLNAGFYGWLESHAQISTGTGKYHALVGLALEKGITGTSTELHAAGQLLEGGKLKGDVQDAVDDGSVKRQAESNKNQGYVKERFTLEASEKLNIQLERTKKLTGCTRDEAQSVMMDAYSAISDEAFKGYKA